MINDLQKKIQDPQPEILEGQQIRSALNKLASRTLKGSGGPSSQELLEEAQKLEAPLLQCRRQETNANKFLMDCSPKNISGIPKDGEELEEVLTQDSMQGVELEQGIINVQFTHEQIQKVLELRKLASHSDPKPLDMPPTLWTALEKLQALPEDHFESQRILMKKFQNILRTKLARVLYYTKNRIDEFASYLTFQIHI